MMMMMTDKQSKAGKDVIRKGRSVVLKLQGQYNVITCLKQQEGAATELVSFRYFSQLK